jgi:hypothetical protein
MRTVAVVLGVIIAGFCIAVGVTLFGCSADGPLVAYCGLYPIGALIWVSLAAWFLLGTLVVGIRALRKGR